MGEYYLNQARDFANVDILAEHATPALLAGILHALIAIAEATTEGTD